jgi:uncharacterized RDD family membrane protein YckC
VSTEPGWHKDPAEPTTQRYWDGEGWVGDPLPIDATPPPGPPAGVPPAPAPHAVPASPVPPAAPPAASGAPPAMPGAPAPPGTPPWAGQPWTAPPWAGPPAGTGTKRPGVPVPPGMVLPPGARWVYPFAVPLPHGLPVAPLGLRCLARVIDFLVVLGLNVVGNGWLVYLYVSDVWPLVNVLWAQATGAAERTNVLPAVPDRTEWVRLLIPLVAVALWFAYEVPAIARGGQTLGKRLVGIKVMALESEEPIGFLRATRRWNPLGLPSLLWIFCGLGFLIQLFVSLSPVLGGPLHLGLYDRSAGTVVVHSGRKGHEITPVKVPEQTGEQP